MIGERVRRIIAAAHDAPGEARDEGGLTDGFGTGQMDVLLPAPPGAVDDWGDRPNPRAALALAGFLTDIGTELAGLGKGLGQIGQRLAPR